MGARRIRREQRRFDMAKSRRENGMLKDKERVRREARMIELIKKGGKLPYTRPVMSWLSVALDKPATKITQAEVDQLLAGRLEPLRLRYEQTEGRTDFYERLTPATRRALGVGSSAAPESAGSGLNDFIERARRGGASEDQIKEYIRKKNAPSSDAAG